MRNSDEVERKPAEDAGEGMGHVLEEAEA